MIDNNNMYRSGCTVLLQAILTQACRVILAFCLVEMKNNKSADKRVVAMASSYVSESEAASLIEGMSKHILLTAVHLLCCEYRPYRSCQHHNGELAAAVGNILQDPSIRSWILTALTDFISRKWRNNEGSIHPLLHRALSVGPVEYIVSPSATDASSSSPISLLLQVYPEFGKRSASGKENEKQKDETAAVSCGGCRHEWFRETLPVVVLTLSMEQHAKAWRRTSLLSTAFVRWRQRHGMYLLRGLVTSSFSYSYCSPPLDVTTQAPSTVPSEEAEWSNIQRSTQERMEKQTSRCCHDDYNGNNNEKKKKDLNRCEVLPQKSVKVHEEKAENMESHTVEAALPTEPHGDGLKKVDASSKVANGNRSDKLLNSFLLECDKLASVRLKQQAFRIWRDVRLVERRNLKHFLVNFNWRRKQFCWMHWKGRVECHRLRKRKEWAEVQYNRLLETKKERLMQKAVTQWKMSFLVKMFRQRTCGYRVFRMWHRAYIFSIHACRNSHPPIADRALVLSCLKQWREKHRTQLADRIFMKRSLHYIRDYLQRRSDYVRIDNIARANAERILKQHCLKTWRKSYRFFILSLHFTRTWNRRFLSHALMTWRVRWIRRIGGIDRMQTFLAMKRQRLIVLSFTRWKKKTNLKRLHIQLVSHRLRNICRSVWTRWVQRLTFNRRLHRDCAELAAVVHQRFLTCGAWRLWRWRCVQREESRRAVQRGALLSRAKERHETQLLATAWFTWKGKAHVMRCMHACKGDTSLGINRSFHRENISMGKSSWSSRAGNTHMFSVLLPERRRCTPSPLSKRRDPLASLRAERVLLRGIDTPQWQTMAHSRLFNTSRGCKDEATTVVMMPSDVENDNSPSADNSHIL